MASLTRSEQIPGPAGPLELRVDLPAEGRPRGLALVAHPHPLFGGSLDNKVVQTVVKALTRKGYCCLRPNFRGVGASAGVHDNGKGEQADLWACWSWAESTLGPTLGEDRVQAGFSFGAVMSTFIARDWQAERAARGLGPYPLRQLILVGFAPERIPPAPLMQPALIVHGEEDEVAPLSSVLRVARETENPVIVVPGASHFFHGHLIALRGILEDQTA